jgi:hypothetical protein
MEELANVRILGLVFFVILVLIVAINKWLLLTSRKDESNHFRNLAAYLPVFKKGWRIACKNIWIFWALLVFSVLSVLQGNLNQYLYNKSLAPGVPFFIPFSHSAVSIFSRIIHDSLSNFFFFLLYAPVHIPTYFEIGDVASIVFLLVFILSVKPIKKFLSQPFAPELQSSVEFLKRNTPFFIIATVVMSLYNVLFLIFPSAFFPSTPFKIRALVIVFLPFKIYWSAVVSSLLTGFILALFQGSIQGKEKRRNLVFVSSLKFFKPLFLFLFILAGFTYCLLAPIQIFSSIFPRWSPYLSSLVIWFYLVFLFSSYLIVQEDIGCKTAFKRNFSMWKENYPQVLPFLFPMFSAGPISNYSSEYYIKA